MHDVGITGRRRDHQRRDAVAIRRVGLGLVVKQHVDHDRIAALRREPQRRHGAEPRRGAHVRPGVDERPRRLGVLIRYGPVQRGHAVTLRRIHVRAVLEQRKQLVAIAAHRGVGHLGTRPGARDTADADGEHREHRSQPCVDPGYPS